MDIDVREIRRKDGQLTGRVIRYGSWLVVATDLEIYMRYGSASTWDVICTFTSEAIAEMEVESSADRARLKELLWID